MCSARESEPRGDVSYQDLRLILDNASDVITRQSMDRTIQYVSPSVARVWGWAPEELIGCPLDDFWHPDDRDRAEVLRSQAMAASTVHMRGRLLCKDGSYRWAEVVGRVARDANGGVVSGITLARDIHDQVRVEEELAECRIINENMKDVVWTLDVDTQRFLYVSPSVEKLLGFTPEELISAQIEDVFPKDIAALLRDRIDRSAADLRSGLASFDVFNTEELEQSCKDGTTVWTEVVTKYCYNERTGVLELCGVTREITERRRLQNELKMLAVTDELTRVPNRRHFLELAAKELNRASRHRRAVSIALLDIDYFKVVNDTLGHSAGDRALVEFASLCQRSIREIDILARIGGDEFALLLPEANADQAATILERVRSALKREPVEGADGAKLTVSMGVTELLGDDDGLDALLSRADRALYAAKAAGRDRIAIGRA